MFTIRLETTIKRVEKYTGGHVDVNNNRANHAILIADDVCGFDCRFDCGFTWMFIYSFIHMFIHISTNVFMPITSIIIIIYIFIYISLFARVGGSSSSYIYRECL